MIVSELKTESLSYGDKTFEYFSNNLVTSAPVDTVTEYHPTTTYAWGTYVQVNSIKRKFRVANVSGVTGKHPVDYLDIDWVDAGAINEYAMFDPSPSSSTSSTTDFTITLDFNFSNTIAIHRLDNIANISVTQYSADRSIEYFSSSLASRSSGRVSYYDYYTRPLDKLSKASIFNGLIAKSNSILDITFTIKANSVGSVGLCAIGYKYDVGATLYATSVGYDDASTYKTDKFGFTSFEKRATIDNLNAQILITNSRIDFAIDTFKRIRGKLSHYIGDERDTGRFKSMDIIGYAKNLNIPIDNPSQNKYPIKIIGGA